MVGDNPFLWPDSTTYPATTTYGGYTAVSPIILPGAGLMPGSSTMPGQGNNVVHLVMLSFDDASVSVPSWVDVSSRVREFSISRGRSTELARVDAGTETLTLDNRDRALDPTNTSSAYYPDVRAMNRVWHRLQFNGVTYDLFKGYVESYEQQWPELGSDAVTIVRAADEFKVLALRNLPTTDPPRDTYADVIAFDQPSAYWRMKNRIEDRAADAEIGPSLSSAGVTWGGSTVTAGPIIGEIPEPSAALGLNATSALSTLVTKGEGPDLTFATEFTAEAWFKCDAYPAIDFDYLMNGNVWTLWLETTGVLTFKFVDTSTTIRTITSTGAITTGAWHHIVVTAVGATWSFWVDNVQVTSAAYSWQFKDTGGVYFFSLGDPTGEVTRFWFDEVAVYKHGLTASRIDAHYQAGVNRGFALGQRAGERIGRILDSISSQAPRDLDTGARSLTGQYMTGQHTLEALRIAETAEAVDAFLFIAGDGTVTFRDKDHRGWGSYVAPVGTFGDDGTGHFGYVDLVVDYSDAFIANDWNATRTNGVTQSTTDATSIAAYLKRPQSLTDLALTDDTDAFGVATDMLAKYKDPIFRVTSIEPKPNDSSVITGVFDLELGDQLRVIRTPMGGGPAIDQQLFIQHIDISGNPAMVYPKVVLGVSPV